MWQKVMISVICAFRRHRVQIVPSYLVIGVSACATPVIFGWAWEDLLPPSQVNRVRAWCNMRA
jgi:hypothetical protein